MCLVQRTAGGLIMQWFVEQVSLSKLYVCVSVYTVQRGSQLDGENHTTIRYLLLC